MQEFIPALNPAWHVPMVQLPFPPIGLEKRTTSVQFFWHAGKILFIRIISVPAQAYTGIFNKVLSESRNSFLL